jgi:hypothetical protein
METSVRKAKKSRKTHLPDEESGEPIGDSQSNDANSLLYLQRTIGNQAVQRKLLKEGAQAGGEPKLAVQREPEGGETGVKEENTDKEEAAVKRPAFLGVSPMKPIPGDPVPEVSKWQPPYTQQNRQFLLDRLLNRNEENAQNGMRFVHNFSSSFLKIWSSYVTDQMAEAGKPDKSFWKELASFAAKVAMVAMFTVPILGELEEAGWAIALFYEKAPEFAAEVVQNHNEQKEGEEKVEKRKEELDDDTEGIADRFADTLTSTMTPLTSGFYYTQWLEEASLADLDKFSLPPLIPKKSKGEIEAAVVQSLAGYYNQKENVDEKKKSRITMHLFADKTNQTGGELVKESPTYHGPEFFGKRLRGKSIQNMPDIPLEINLETDGGFEQRLFNENGGVIGDVFDVELNWPSKGPMMIYRDQNGAPYWIGGGMGEMLYLYLLARSENINETYDHFVIDVLKEEFKNWQHPFEQVIWKEQPNQSFMGEESAAEGKQGMGGSNTPGPGEEQTSQANQEVGESNPSLMVDEGPGQSLQDEQEPNQSFQDEDQSAEAGQNQGAGPTNASWAPGAPGGDETAEANPAAEAEAAPRYDVAEAAKAFYEYLVPGVYEGVQMFVQNQVERLSVDRTED